MSYVHHQLLLQVRQRSFLVPTWSSWSTNYCFLCVQRACPRNHWLPELTGQDVGLLLLFSCSVVSYFLWAMNCSLLSPWDSPGKDTGVGCHFLFQGILPTHGSIHISSSSCIQVDSLPLSHQGSHTLIIMCVLKKKKKHTNPHSNSKR